MNRYFNSLLGKCKKQLMLPIFGALFASCLIVNQAEASLLWDKIDVWVEVLKDEKNGGFIEDGHLPKTFHFEDVAVDHQTEIHLDLKTYPPVSHVLKIDVDESKVWIKLIRIPDVPITTNMSEEYYFHPLKITLSDLDWRDDEGNLIPGEIRNVTLKEGSTLPTLRPVFGKDFIMIQTEKFGEDGMAGEFSAHFHIQTVHIPEPETYAILGGMLTCVFFFRKSRRHLLQ